MLSLDRGAIDSDADRVVRTLSRAGYKAYLVGGCVRDLLLGKTPKDFDVATSATPPEIRRTFRNSRIIGRRFRLTHVVFGSKVIDTATFRANPRDDNARDLLIRHDNVFGTETEDAQRRDFTINGLFYDVERGEVIDHVGGLADLDARLVRTIGDPEIRFQEDPVRMLRAIKFAARLELGFEPATWRALVRWRSEISKCSPSRLRDEMHRLLLGGAARRSFELMVETGVLAVLSPYLAGLLDGSGAPTRAPAIADAAPRPTIARVEDDDPDDPDETATSGATEDEELDIDERAWHRVWADDPAEHPMLATPVRLSYLGGTELAKRRALTWAALEQIDLVVRRGRDPSTAVAFAILIAPFIHFPDAEPRTGVLEGAILEASRPLITQLHVTRGDSEHLRHLLVAQHRLSAARRRNAQAELAGGREVNEDAALLYTLLERAAGNDAVLPEIRTAKDQDGSDQPRKRRRRRARWATSPSRVRSAS